ncbi:MAG: AraC family transcriptional regulator [Marinobacter sp.]|uniref:helix-turn-helix transcriptional regulator n=1 Tax=unclassified Marinobacter TaxID=83889 RepID=UPI00264A9786|nr:AraC family transcriptional regulator [Marinobacter sp. 2_MG-2023]MDN6320409.1 AraC family transcriptional regulator [Marinobacter sp.]MDO6442610.1 AraC family transcriptional regulator [Marinobacter sp. 2_MG-2023]
MASLIESEELPVWVPGEVLTASDNLGWLDVGQRSYRYAGLDVPIPPMNHYMIVRYFEGQTPMDRRIDSRWTRTTCVPGHISLLSRARPSHWHWTQQIDVSHVYLSENLMSRVAQDVLGRPISEVSLHDVLNAEDPTVTSISDAILGETRNSAIGGPTYAEALGLQLSVHLLRNYADVKFREDHSQSGLSKRQRSALTEFIYSNLQHQISIEQLSAVTGLGVWTFCRRFKASYGVTPCAHLLDTRVEQAKLMLAKSSRPIKAIATECGFSDQAHMTRAFRRKLNLTPGQIRQSRSH